MAAVTVLDQSEVFKNMKALRVTIAATGDTLETPFTRILSVQMTPETTTAATTYWDYDISGGTVTFNGAGTGFAFVRFNDTRVDLV